MRECAYVSLCVDMIVCVYICSYVNVQFFCFFLFFICLLFLFVLFVCCLFHQSLFANCVLPTMYKGEAYISASLLLPPFSSQSVTLWNIMQLIKIVFYERLKYLLYQCMIIINDIWFILICLLCSHFVWK